MKISLLTVVIACSLRKGLGAIDFVDPPSGSVIAGFEGTENVTTIFCNVSSSGIQATTRWSIENFRDTAGLQNIANIIMVDTSLFMINGDPIPGDPPGSTFGNQLTILNLASELDGLTLYCGTGASPQQSNFEFRIYRPPNLQDNLMLRIVENSLNVPVNLSQNPAGFPEPTSFNWTRNGVELSGPTLTFSRITFPTVSRSNAGRYEVSATNFILGGTQQIGSDTGSFVLDVIYGPMFEFLGPLQRYVLLGDTLSLVCGTGLDSNPPANVTWTAPDGNTIVDNARYDLENGPQIVRLNFTHTILSDNGVWVCDVRVTSRQDVVSNGVLVRQDPTVIGTPIIRNIRLNIIATPSPPHTLSVDRIEATSIRICWVAPLEADSAITFYSISVSNLNSTDAMVMVVNTTTNDTFFNIIDLLPGTTYELTVVAVSQGGDVVAKSDPSDPVTPTTDNTVPALMCGGPVFRDGGITSTWSYIHTGGLSLNRVSVSYTFEEGSSTSSPIHVMTFVNAQPTEVSVPRLVAGRRYTFNITAENDVGSSYIMCGPTLVSIGLPALPQFGDLASGPNPGEVTLQIKTVASGVDSTSPQFQFNIVPVLDGVEGEGREIIRNDYVSGTFETVTISDLQPGQSYTFSATAVNSFGRSETENSQFVTAAGARSPSPTPPQTAGDSSAGLVGGVVGGILAVVVVVAAVIVIIVLLLFWRGRRDYHPKKIEGEYHLAPSSDPTVKVEEVPAVDIGEEKTKPDTENEIQYAELDTIRQPSRPKNVTDEPKPVQPEEPVEYAVITSFKKVDDPATSSVPAPTSPSADDNADSDKAGTSTTLV